MPDPNPAASEGEPDRFLGRIRIHIFLEDLIWIHIFYEGGIWIRYFLEGQIRIPIFSEGRIRVNSSRIRNPRFECKI